MNERNDKGGCGCLLLLVFFILACNGTISPGIFVLLVFLYLFFG